MTDTPRADDETQGDVLPEAVREGLARARDREQRRTGGRLRVQVGEAWYPIRSYDAEGFTVAIDVAPKLRGLVEIHDGPALVRSALIVAGDADEYTIRYGFKRATAVRDRAALDYEVERPETAGLLGRD
ncbi:hypothetical protein [Jannaschia sp. W003]|uniref:hypothetical protein n=1 Tax=Jannaschia sp. W003 TaxID=2867012 RepID=UPI0021A495D3|nr:hypothetical protein [Jannaschia sp. W003]UWQ22316.1 hypothetical protein K3554_04585 [Jannaschia sp. W003]